MNRLISFAVRALSLVAATGITAVIFFVHAVDGTRLGAREVAASGALALSHTDKTGEQPAARVALAHSSIR